MPPVKQSRSNTFHFGCTGCGMCCTAPPSIYLEEILEQSRHFILNADIRCIAVLDPEDPAKISQFAAIYPGQRVGDISVRRALSAQARRVGLGRGIRVAQSIFDSDECYLLVLLNPISLYPQSCPQRTVSGACAIHDRRPMKCALAPLDEAIPEHLSLRDICRTIDRLKARGGTCLTGPEAPALLQNNAFIDPTTIELHRRLEAPKSIAMRELNRAAVQGMRQYIGFAQEIDETEAETMMQYMGTRRVEAQMITIAPLLHCLAVRTSHLTKDEAFQILSNQVALLEQAENPSSEGHTSADPTRLAQIPGWKDLYVREAFELATQICQDPKRRIPSR